MTVRFTAGAAVRDISPRDSQFLYGYPHVPRYSNGIHDPLLSTSLYLCDGNGTQAIIVANDIVCLSKAMCRRIRTRVEAATGVPASHILISATHTHSGPITVTLVSNASDLAVPAADPLYLRFLESQLAESAIEAFRAARPAELGLSVARSPILRTNRHDPDGPSDREIPVLAVRDTDRGAFIACMAVYSLHPTVLHEDSLLVSADYPGMLRQYLQETILGKGCPFLYHLGPAGNQSPRYAIRSKDFAAARQLGQAIGEVVQKAIGGIRYADDHRVAVESVSLDLMRRALPSVDEAAVGLKHAREHLEALRRTSAPAGAIRTAECDCFGAEETLTLAEAANGNGGLEAAYASCLPCEIQAVLIGPWSFVAWPGEFFVEYGLDVKRRLSDAFVITLANGDLQGYIVTEEAAAQQRYEACNAILDHRNGPLIAEASERLVRRMRDAQGTTRKQSEVEVTRS